MNYLRGAVNAISAPYQYYKELPPINPSTLTGAIDVIVVRRPSKDGGTELACSPFHVRFGKWQVLRPSDKRVNVSVNGNPIPYHMKIGEAGEAFFVFETDENVPDDLITSPILKPTGEVDENDAAVDSKDTGGTSQDNGLDLEPGRHRLRVTSEPEFLDLDALPTSVSDKTPKPLHKKPAYTRSQPSTSSIPKLGVERTPSMDEQDQRVDEALSRRRPSTVIGPDVEYHEGVALDIEGYHTRKRSEETIKNIFTFPSVHDRSNPSDSLVEPDSIPGTPSPPISFPHSSESSDDLINANLLSPHSLPSFRAASEPPPDVSLTSTDDSAPGNLRKSSAYNHIRVPSMKLETHSSMTSPGPSSPSPSPPPPSLQLHSHQQQYSWEWGGFPIPSPMKTTFPSVKGKERAQDILPGSVSDSFDQYHDHGSHDADDADDEELTLDDSLRLNNAVRKSRRVRRRKSQSGHHRDTSHKSILSSYTSSAALGVGGQIRVNESDPTQFIYDIEGKEFVFELSLINECVTKNAVGDKNQRHPFHELDGIEAARLFNQGKITFHTFLDDATISEDSRLIMHWSNHQYITQNDGSPLMDALKQWRVIAVQHRQHMSSSLPTVASGATLYPKEEARLAHVRSKSEPPEDTHTNVPESSPKVQERVDGSHVKPSTLSWVQWWSRSRRGGAAAIGKDKKGPEKDRPGLRETVSAPPAPVPIPPQVPLFTQEIPRSAPAAESVTSSKKTEAVQERPVAKPLNQKRYAKTLRLTSDQLKALSLKSGTNTITFSLSASGVIACTARIFVWDSTDLIVISDIDGTITKSDGLGHVFAMIGRDWTHLGVAKLYTDIVRNGYKIMYLTSRAIGQADATRYYLKGIKQNDYQLPEGPVVMSPDRLMASLHREVIMRKPELFKMACLRDIRNLFGETARNPFYAGFGNRITDALSYRSVNVPSARIFTIDSSGEVKLELLELAGYKSSYIHMTDLVDQMFPPINQKWNVEYTDFNFWKTPVPDIQLPDPSPPSPTLSARSDGSTRSALARLRNFSLGGSRRQTMTMNNNGNQDDLRKNVHLRQMSSLERLGTSLVDGFRRSMSPDSRSESSVIYTESENEDSGGEWEVSEDGKKRWKRERRRSIGSMPGSLDDMHFFGLDEYEEGPMEEPVFGEYERSKDGEVQGEESGQLHVNDVADEEALDEDLFLATEMKNVPFL
ncbi:hypothetical protein AMATHDRAFT_59413 [Amanita thiersii Skay4041]|uniref:LNS2/PITP domain-containing protein n=1 Tax=Amanita thiersii Skay4041 TaxID=703135 RepID=A0A2A9NUF7_9AGAR|nr:hypothetical protein AMATHDRAFT_59413 [Amanita thiersii Skay4041]